MYLLPRFHCSWLSVMSVYCSSNGPFIGFRVKTMDIIKIVTRWTALTTVAVTSVVKGWRQFRWTNILAPGLRGRGALYWNVLWFFPASATYRSIDCWVVLARSWAEKIYIVEITIFSYIVRHHCMDQGWKQLAHVVFPIWCLVCDRLKYVPVFFREQSRLQKQDKSWVFKFVRIWEFHTIARMVSAQSRCQSIMAAKKCWNKKLHINCKIRCTGCPKNVPQIFCTYLHSILNII